MQRKFYALIVLGMVALVAPRVVRGTFLCSSRIHGTLGMVLTGDALADPVVEEPIRPLGNPGSMDASETFGRCGSVQAVMLVGGLAALVPLRILRRRLEP